MLTDKSRFSLGAASRGFPTAKLYTLLNHPHTVDPLPPFPCMVRPALSLVGKSGVRRVENASTLEQAIQEALDSSYNGRVMIEEYLPGRDFSLIAFAVESRLHPVCFIDELNRESLSGSVIPIGVAVPSLYAPKEVRQEALTIAQSVISSFKLETTPLHVAFRWGETGLHVVEIHLDMGGDLILDRLLPESCGLNVMEHAIRLLSRMNSRPLEARFSPTAVLFDSSSTDRRAQMLKAATRTSLERVVRDRIVRPSMNRRGYSGAE
jgi:biotin carboxylase